MSVATVKAHVSRLLMKLDLDNRVQIALLVHDAGLSRQKRQYSGRSRSSSDGGP